MAISFRKADKLFRITTKNTLYAFSILGDRYLLHLYYGKKRAAEPLKYDRYCVSFAPYLPECGNTCSPDIFPQELSFYGSGDFRIPALRVKNPTGDSCTRFFYKSHKIFKGRKELPGLPFARADEETETLCVTLADPDQPLTLRLYYTVFYESDVISRYMELENRTGSEVTIEKCMPLCLELPGMDYTHWTFYGGHVDERHLQRAPLHHGIQSICSRRGASSHQYNPLMAFAAPGVSEDKGEIYGCNFVYSGSFLGEAEVDQTDCTRVLLGLGSEDFAYTLTSGESFTSPEAVLTYSREGYGGMARNFHRFANRHIVPVGSAEMHHPVVLNTWEACYFNIDEEKLVAFAKEAAATGMDMLVMDDGWFGARNHDRAGLGDWTPNPAKFKNGLGSFVRRVKAEGIRFGIWIEPEMVNPDSDLFRAHPDWCLRAGKRENSLSREQLVLDMSNPAVVDYLIDSFSKTFDGVEIDYFKWDMNRHLSEVGSAALPPEKQNEVFYRFMLGTYKLLGWLRERFPNAFLETCSGGGGRYDLGMMAYGHQIWTSDHTNPYARMWMQYSSLMGYPASQMSCHVSNPGEDRKSLDFRYKVAVGGMLGYELNILRSNEAVKADMHEQIVKYLTYEKLIREGDYYPLLSPFDHPYSAYYYASPERDEFLLTFVQGWDCLARCTRREKTALLKVKEAKPGVIYVDSLSGVKLTGEELRAGIPVEVTDEKDRALLWNFKKA